MESMIEKANVVYPKVRGITTYVENDKTYFQVYVHVRSKKRKTIREQKRIKYIESFEKAVRILTDETANCTSRMNRREASGDTWVELVDRWEMHYMHHVSPKFSKQTRLEYVSRIRKWTVEWFNIPAKEISSGMVEDLFEKSYKGGASFSRRKEIKIAVNAIFTWAIGRKYIQMDCSPTKGVQVYPYPDEARGEKPKLIKKLEVIRDALDKAKQEKHRWYPIWLVATYTGMRSGELNGLRRSDFDLISEEQAKNQDQLIESGKASPDQMSYGVIHVQRAWVKKLQRLGDTKAGYNREVDINRELYWFLVEYFTKTNWGSDEAGERVFEKILTWDRGSEAGVIKSFFVKNGWGDMTFHVLRAFWATQLLKAGVGANVIMKMGGWSDYETMMIYIRHAGIEVKGATSSLNLAKTHQMPNEEIPVATGNVVQLFCVK